MSRRLFLFDHPDRFVAGVVGEPGNRAFYLQARQDRATVSVGLEKTQVAALAQRVGELLVAVGEVGGTAITAGGPVPSLEEPIVEVFRVGVLALGWDPEETSLFIEARPVNEDGDYPEVADDETDGPDVLRVHLDAPAARRFAVAAGALVAAGRPACPFCGQPLDPSGHFCPRMNGHLN
jgi:uncharacterized repeat protein (TIGR03847 family)